MAGPEISAALRRRLQSRLLAWFEAHRRDLPWRGKYDPYRVWISEMMLQQTQVETVKPYFTRWMKRFPDVNALAEASMEEVLKAWEGLGYYARARNLHQAARDMAKLHGGQLPDDHAALLALPGIGPYSAGAIASIAFGHPVPAVDGNVARVLSRLFALKAWPASSGGKAALWQLAERLVPRRQARDFNQALMELGATICGRRPVCGECPVGSDCLARRLEAVDRYPVRRPRPVRLRIAAVMAVFGWRESVLLRRRPARGLWGGMWEFPWEPSGANESPAEVCRRIAAAAGVELAAAPRAVGIVRHGLTHREYTWHCMRGPVRGKRMAPHQPEAGYEFRWADAGDLAALPLARPMRKALHLVAAENTG